MKHRTDMPWGNLFVQMTLKKGLLESAKKTTFSYIWCLVQNYIIKHLRLNNCGSILEARSPKPEDRSIVNKWFCFLKWKPCQIKLFAIKTDIHKGQLFLCASSDFRLLTSDKIFLPTKLVVDPMELKRILLWVQFKAFYMVTLLLVILIDKQRLINTYWLWTRPLKLSFSLWKGTSKIYFLSRFFALWSFREMGLLKEPNNLYLLQNARMPPGNCIYRIIITRLYKIRIQHSDN